YACHRDLHSFPTRRSSDLYPPLPRSPPGVRATTRKMRRTIMSTADAEVIASSVVYHKVGSAEALRNGEPLGVTVGDQAVAVFLRSEEHTSELQSRENLVCR